MSFCHPTRALLIAVLLLTGCTDREITAYRAPKDPTPAAMPPATTAGSAMADTAVPTGSDNLVWTAPAEWTVKPASAMRKGSFAVTGPDDTEADLSITAFPGDTGGLLANLNRWRGQIALAPLSDSQLDDAIDHLDAHGFHFDIVDFTGTANGVPTRILGAILPHNGETWFFKLMGPDALVASQKDSFREFLNTVKESGQ